MNVFGGHYLANQVAKMKNLYKNIFQDITVFYILIHKSSQQPYELSALIHIP